MSGALTAFSVLMAPEGDRPEDHAPLESAVRRGDIPLLNGWYMDGGSNENKKNLQRSDSVTRGQRASHRSDHAMKRNSSGERLPPVCFVLTAKHLRLYAFALLSPFLYQ